MSNCFFHFNYNFPFIHPVLKHGSRSAILEKVNLLFENKVHEMKVKIYKDEVVKKTAILAELNFNLDGFELNLCYCNPKDVDLYKKRMKPSESWVEVRLAF